MNHGLFFVSLKVILKNPQNQILGLQAENKGDLAGYYDLPGGRIDDNEIGLDFPQLIDREIKEEAGDIEYILNPKPIHSLSWNLSSYEHPFTYIYYEAKYVSGEIKISDEHIGYKWINPDTDKLPLYFTSFHLIAIKSITK